MLRLHPSTRAKARTAAVLSLAVPLALASEPWTLERAVEQALAANPDARLAAARIAAASAGIEQARAAFQPRVSVGAGYLRTDNPAQAFGMILNQEVFDPGLDFNDVPDADNLNVHGLLVVPLYQGGSSAADRDQAEARSTAARHEEQAVERHLEFEVARTFFTIDKTREFIQAATVAVDAFASNVEIARRRHVAGTALKSDVLDVEVRWARAREDLVRARNANSLARHALRNLLAVDDEQIDIATAEVALEVPPPDTVPARPELAAAAELRTAATAAVRGARGGDNLRVDAFGRLDYNQGFEFDGADDSYAAGVELRWDVWDGHRTRGLVNDAQARLDAATEYERKLRLALDLEIAQARLALAESEERIEVTRTATELAAESVALTRARFEQGLALATQLIDAETELTGARVRRAEAEADRQIAIAALRRALGLPLFAVEAGEP